MLHLHLGSTAWLYSLWAFRDPGQQKKPDIGFHNQEGKATTQKFIWAHCTSTHIPLSKASHKTKPDINKWGSKILSVDDYIFTHEQQCLRHRDHEVFLVERLKPCLISFWYVTLLETLYWTERISSWKGHRRPWREAHHEEWKIRIRPRLHSKAERLMGKGWF